MSARSKIETQNDKQLFEFIKALLLANKGIELDGIQARILMQDKYGVYADHHVYTEIMDGMTRTGQARCTQGWGTNRYIIL